MCELWEYNLIRQHWVHLSNAGMRELRETLPLQVHCQDGLCQEAGLLQVRSDDDEVGEGSGAFIIRDLQGWSWGSEDREREPCLREAKRCHQ